MSYNSTTVLNIKKELNKVKVLLCQEGEKVLSKSGVGRAMKHQIEALKLARVDFTTDNSDDYDILHVNTVGMDSYHVAKKAHKHNKKVVYHAHSTEEDFKNSFAFSNLVSPLFKRWLVRCYSLGDVILTPTPYSKKVLEKYNLPSPIVSISNGVDLDLFKKDQAKIKKFRHRFNLSPSDKVIISVGHFFERKGLPDFFEIAREFPEYTFIWFGYTPTAAVTDKIRKAINSKPDNVIMPGYIKGDIIQGAYAAADLFFFPSYEETEGIVVLEALAANCQVILRDIGVYDPWLVDKMNCYKGNSNEEFISILKDYFSNKIPSTTKQGYEVAKERSLDKIGQQLKQVYEDVLNN